MNVVFDLADVITVLVYGEVIASDVPARIRGDKAVQEAYLGTEAALMLEVSGLHAYYGKSHILQGVDLAIGEGEIVSLLGRNGVGRSTTCKAIMGLIRPEGEVRFKGRPIAGLRADEIAHAGLGYVPEDRQIFARPDGEAEPRTGAEARRQVRPLDPSTTCSGCSQPRRARGQSGRRPVGRRGSRCSPCAAR